MQISPQRVSRLIDFAAVLHLRNALLLTDHRRCPGQADLRISGGLAHSFTRNSMTYSDPRWLEQRGPAPLSQACTVQGALIFTDTQKIYMIVGRDEALGMFLGICFSENALEGQSYARKHPHQSSCGAW